MKVLHVLASEQRRGAEIFARDLIGAMSCGEFDQRVLVLRRSRADVDFGVPALPYPLDVRSLRRSGGDLFGTGWRPDIVQAHGGEAMKASLALRGRSSVPVVYRRIGLAPRRLSRFPRRQAFARLARRADLVIAVSDAVRTEAEALFGLRAPRIVTIPNGVDPERLRPRRSRAETRRLLGIAPDATVVLSLGALSWEKDPIAHVGVVADVLRSHHSVAHLLVGDGPLRASVATEVRRAGTESHTRILGSRSDVAELLAASDVLLFASRADGMEGMPAAVIEAAAAGLPVAAYAVAGVPEVVADGETGLLSAPADRTDLQRNLVSLLGDAGLRARMGAEARRRCATLYDIGVVADGYGRVYAELLTGSDISLDAGGAA